MAKQIGRSPSSVRKYMSGKTNELHNDANSKLTAAKAQDTMRKAGVLQPDGTPKVATIRVTGRVHVRNGDEAGYDYRTRTLDFGNSDVPFSAEESRELAAALANDDQARVVAILERHATLDYPENRGSASTATSSDSTSTPLTSSTSPGIEPGSTVIQTVPDPAARALRWCSAEVGCYPAPLLEVAELASDCVVAVIAVRVEGRRAAATYSAKQRGNYRRTPYDYQNVNKRSLSIALTTLVLVPLAAAGCTRSADSTDTAAPETSAAAPAFPVTVTDCNGKPTTITEAPSKVVTANLAALELVIRLGRADRVVGTGWAAGVAALPEDIRPTAQSVPALSKSGIPKEVLLTSGANAYIDAFGSMQMMGGDTPTEQDYANAEIDHFFLSSSACAATLPGKRTDLDAVYTDITTIGGVLEAGDEADALVSQMKNKLAETASAHPARQDRPKVFYYSPDHTMQGMTTVGGKQIANAIYELAGAQNVFADDATSMRPVSWEDVIAADPDYIQIATRNKATAAEQAAAYDDAITALRADPRARDLRAVREGKFIDLGAEETTLPGVANADAVATIANAINTP